MKRDPDPAVELIETLAEALCRGALEAGLRAHDGKPLRPWESLRDGSSRAESERTLWCRLAGTLLDVVGPGSEPIEPIEDNHEDD